MKTFEEACEKTFVAVIRGPKSTPVSEAEKTAAMAPIESESERYASLHNEVQCSFYGRTLAGSLLEQVENGMPPEVALVVAFSHGVMVGVEMEKP